MVEVRLPVDAMGGRLVGREVGLFKQGKGYLQSERERERELCDDFSGCEKAVGERQLWGVERC